MSIMPAAGQITLLLSNELLAGTDNTLYAVDINMQEEEVTTWNIILEFWLGL